jgi:DNA primase
MEKEMTFDFESFCQDNSIDYSTEGNRHSRPGWINIHCLFCQGIQEYHLGWNLEKGYFNCWRCGFHPVKKVVARILNISEAEAWEVIKHYEGESTYTPQDKKLIRSTSEVSLPVGCCAMTDRHRRYLKKRGFNPERLEKEWSLLGTGPVGPYKFRIIAPIFYKKKLVSYQGRDITGRTELRYKTCAKENEVRDHKHCLYGLDEVEGDSVIVVEGITDAWRLGVGNAVATFGIIYTPAQVGLLMRFKNVFVFFDSADPQAIKQAEELGWELGAFGINAEIIETRYADPGSMPERYAKSLKKELLS